MGPLARVSVANLIHAARILKEYQQNPKKEPTGARTWVWLKIEELGLHMLESLSPFSKVPF